MLVSGLKHAILDQRDRLTALLGKPMFEIGLNFSCDGSHYLPYDEFLDKGQEFWFGALGS